MGNASPCHHGSEESFLEQSEEIETPCSEPRMVGLLTSAGPIHKPLLVRDAGENKVGKAKSLPVLDGGDDGQDLEELLSLLEQVSSSVATHYRKALASPNLDVGLISRADEVLRTVGHRVRRLQYFQVRGQSWHSSEANRWVDLFTGHRRRFKSLAEIVRKVRVENRIVKHWQSHSQGQLAKRALEEEAVVSTESLRSKLDLEKWDGVNVFDIEKENRRPLATVFMAIWRRRQLNQLSKAKSGKVLAYLTAVEDGYKQTPYHNKLHAAEVTWVSYFFWSSLSSQAAFAGYFTEVDLLVLVLASAIHDLGHPAVNNDFMVKTKSDLAIRYHETAVLENFHVASAFELMKEHGVPLLEHNLPSPPTASLRKRVVDMVLATDMAVHKSLVEEMERAVRQNQSRQEIDKILLEKNLVHLADIGHPLRPVAQHQDWAKRVTEEFFAQGDREKDLGFSPIALFDRKEAPPLPKGQIGFLNFVVWPAWKPIAVLMGPAADEPEQCFKKNLEVWTSQLEQAAEPGKLAGGC
eukprot:TRINITY_DN49823_c0_g1_i1.p1 TRINITY_DN49823_c0_g1~~TRINITY_DN49823_c0_g1_i1.p1  ORF type:complete len:523 (-),score=93.19 TRINITY_DN49823_c0_g1_i1:108-1676(-)